jgi:transposase
MNPRQRHKKVPDTKDQRIAELEAQLERARVLNQRLQKQLERLQAEVEELRRSGKRQAVPFARRKLVEKPKRPGRKVGQGTFGHRARPTKEQVQETKVTYLCGCPDCGGRLKEVRSHEQYVADIPVVKPILTRYVTYSGYCGKCHRRVRSRHPEQTSQASGAAGVQVGPRAKALARI